MQNNIHQEAIRLNDTYGWNIVPMYYFTRNKEGKKQYKFIDWQKYKAEPYDLTNWKEEYTALSIITGQISNLTVLDIDSQEALDTILNTLNKTLDELSEYIVQTRSGYQLFYSYEPNTRTRIGIKDKIDFLNGGLSFAHGTNDGYTVIKSGTLTPIPKDLKDLILDKENEAESDDMQDFEQMLRENSILPFKNPLQPLVKACIDSTRMSKKIRPKLEKVFCTKNYVDYELTDFARPGQIHASMIYVAGIVAANPTVSKDMYIEFMQWWAKKIAKIDLSDAKEQQYVRNRIKAGMNFFRYEPLWKKKAEELKTPDNLIVNRKHWYNHELDKYVIYDLKSSVRMTLNKTAYKDQIARDYNELNEEKIDPSDVDVTKVKTIIETFDPTVDDRFFTDEYGYKMFNNFKRTPMLAHFQTCDQLDKMPEFLGHVIHHAYPVKEERDMFLHTLAYHMTYLQVSPTAYILTGRSGTGKNMVMQGILSEIYGDMYDTISAETLTGRFRDRLKNKLLVFIDEVSEKSHNPTERGSIHNVIKQIVANPCISVETKGKDETTYPNHALYTMASNKDVPFKLEEGFDRRVNITKTNNENIRELDWFPIHLSTTEIDDLVIKEVPDFVAYLAGIELDHLKWSMTIENSQRRDLILSSVPEINQYIDSIMDMDIERLYTLDHDFAEWFEQVFIKEGRASCPVRELKTQLGSNYIKVSKALKSAGVTFKPVDNIRSIVLNPKGHDKKALDAFEEETA